MAANTVLISKLWCNTCQIESFSDDGDWKQHHKSELHWYNLNRKLNGLAPVTQSHLDDVVEKRMAVLNTNSRGTSHLKTVKQKARAKVCPNIYEPAASPTPGKEMLTGELIEARTVESVEVICKDSVLKSNENFDYDPRMCLFDNTVCETPEENLKHMENVHCFTLPEKGRLRDLSGCLAYFGNILWVNHQCLFCLKPFTSLQAARNHMNDSSHTTFGGTADCIDEDMLKFYDFTDILENEDSECDDSDWIDVAEEDEHVAGPSTELNVKFAKRNKNKSFVNRYGNLVVGQKEIVPHSLKYIYVQRIRYNKPNTAERKALTNARLLSRPIMKGRRAPSNLTKLLHSKNLSRKYIFQQNKLYMSLSVRANALPRPMNRIDYKMG